MRQMVVETKRSQVLEAVRAHRGLRAYLFGSVARGDDTPQSDIDVLVEFDTGSSLFDVMHLEEALEELLGAPVDVVSAGGLLPRDEHIRREAIPI